MKDARKGKGAFDDARPPHAGATQAMARGSKRREAVDKKARPASKGRVHKGRTRR